MHPIKYVEKTKVILKTTSQLVGLVGLMHERKLNT